MDAEGLATEVVGARGRALLRRLLPPALSLGALAMGAAAADTGTPAPSLIESDALPELCAARLTDAVNLDGDLSDPAWQQACRTRDWFEVSPGDNTPPRVETIGYVAYDDRYLYVAFDCRDPDPRRIRSALGDRDDYGLSDAAGIVLDTRGDGKIAAEFWVNAGGSQYDAVLDDATDSEDAAPDFHWASAARVTQSGWALEVRIPFTALRYSGRNPGGWRIMLQRNYPREYFYQMATARLPRGSGCFVCRAHPLRGLAELPEGGALALAPYVSARHTWLPRVGAASTQPELGGDLKWTPRPEQAFDAALRPDFSQVEADVAQIGANERFALFYPEKRPLFLEGRELLATPVQAVHTRTVTSPAWGLRATGRAGPASYALLAARDEGGGSVVLPGPSESSLAPQDFASYVLIGRLRGDFGRSFVGLLATDREVAGGGHNRVLGPDFQWRPNLRDTFTGQWLWSWSLTPERPDLAAEWDGRRLEDRAGLLRWRHASSALDWLTEYRQVGDDFRADDGFVPQVGYRQTYGTAGWTRWPDGWVRRLRLFVVADRSVDRHGDTLDRRLAGGASFGGRWSSSGTLQLAAEQVRSGGLLLPQRRLELEATVRPLGLVSEVQLAGWVGAVADVENGRPGTGSDVNVAAALRPSRHVELAVNLGRRALDVDPAGTGGSRLFTARVGRAKGTYHLSPRAFVRLVAQYVDTRRDPALYRDPVARRSAGATASALFAYRLNWQTLAFLGYGDERALTGHGRLEPARRELFFKLSYAFLR